MLRDVPKVGRVYELNHNSVSPTRPAGRDKNGIPREEVVCALAKWERFVDTDGNVCDVPLQCGRVLSVEPEAERIEITTRRTQIAAGCLPLNECPHTTKYADWVLTPDEMAHELEEGEKLNPSRGMLVPLPGGEESAPQCFGKAQPKDWPAGKPFFGCEHMEAVIKARRAACKDRNDAMQRQMQSVDPRAIAHATGEGIASALEKFLPALPGARQRSRLADSKGED